MQSIDDKDTLTQEIGTRLEGIDYIDRPGVYAVMEDSQKQIAVIETGAGYFLPGGGIDAGETEVEALEREVLEETGYRVTTLAEIGKAIEYIRAHSDGKYYRIRSTFYKVQIFSKTGEGVEPDHQLVWLSYEDASWVLARQSQVWAIQRLKRKNQR